MKYKVSLLLTLAIIATVSLQAQLNVGSTAPADASAILQATSTAKGFLPPVMTTTQINAIVLPANGLTVYNTTLSQLQVNVGTPAVPSWSVAASGASVYWSQQGNTGTVPGTNYIGTTDNVSLAFGTNNAERVRIDSSTGFVGIGTTTPHAPLQFANTVVTRKMVLLDQGTSAGNDSAFYGFGINSATLRYQVPAGGNHSFYVNKTIVGILSPGYFNLLNGTIGNSSFGIGRTGIEGSFSIVGVNSSYANGALAGDAVLRADTGSLYVSTFTNKPLMLRTGDVERMRITPAGNVGIGTATPAALLDIAGNVRVATTASGATTDSILTISSSTGIINKRSLLSVNSNIYNGDGTLTSARTMQLNGNQLTFNGAPGGLAAGINILSGSSGAWSQLGFGRTGTEGTIGITAQGNQILNAAATGDMLIYTGANSLQMGSNGAGAVVLSTSAAERLRITPAGLIGINTSAPTHNLEINGSAGIIGTNSLQFGSGVTGQDAAAGSIGYQTYTAGALDVVGAGTSGTNRIVKLWDNVTIPGTLGIGTLTPAAKLQIVASDNNQTTLLDVQPLNQSIGVGIWYGGIRSTGSNTNSDLNLDAKGSGQIILNNVTSGSVYIPGRLNMGNGLNNIYIGSASGSVATGTGNQFVGIGAGQNSSSGTNNVFTGYHSGLNNTTGSSNVFTGFAAGNNNTTGSENDFTGFQSGSANTTGVRNEFAGAYSGTLNTTGSDNTFTGWHAGINNSTGANNTFLGRDAGANSTTGSSNTFTGFQSGVYNTTGYNNTYQGYYAGGGTNTGNSNVIIGYTSGYNNSTGSQNTFVGINAGNGTTTGNNNTAIGSNAGSFGGTFSNATSIGNGAPYSSSNSVVLGNSSVTTIGGYAAFSNFSDARFKYNIKANVSGLEFIQKLRPVTYQLDVKKAERFTKDGVITASFSEDATATMHTGFLAQDVEKAANELGISFDGVHIPENDRDHYSLAYAQFVVPLVKGMQEQQEQIEKLTKQNIAINAQNITITSQNAEIIAHNKTLDAQNLAITAQLSDMAALKLAVAQLTSQLNKTPATQAALPIPVTVKN